MAGKLIFPTLPKLNTLRKWSDCLSVYFDGLLAPSMFALLAARIQHHIFIEIQRQGIQREDALTLFDLSAELRGLWPVLLEV